MSSVTHRIVAASLLFATAALLPAQDNAALIDALARKGILTDQEAEDLRADLAKENSAATVSTAKGSFLDKVTLTGRLQLQYVQLSTDIKDPNPEDTIPSPADPADSDHFFIRRARIGVRANFMANLSGFINYDLGGTFFDAATITWKANDMFSLDAGLRKAPIGMEEFITSSGSLKAIERSAVTRYFMEDRNDRVLGAGKYRLGVWGVIGNQKKGLSGQVAITNPEGVSTGSGAGATSNGGNDTQAFWSHIAYRGTFTDGSWMIGSSAGFLPKQGGRQPAASGSPRYDMLVGNLMGEVTFLKNFTVAAEFYRAEVENGVNNGVKITPSGWYVQPSYRMGNFDIVARYGMVDTDGRGIALSDGIRRTPSGGNMDELREGYLGGNWYLRGNDVKLSLGYVWGETEGAEVGNGPTDSVKATTSGIRSQMQINF